MAQLKVTLVKSLIGSKKDQIATAQALGLRKIGAVSYTHLDVYKRQAVSSSR